MTHFYSTFTTPSIFNMAMLSGITSVAFASTSFADEIPENMRSIKLSPITSLAHPISNANVSVIDDTFITNTQAKDLREVFNKNAEIQVGGSAQIAQKLYIRGFEDRMFRIRLDGITQSGNLFHHQGNFLFDPFLIKNIEIEKGLANVEYGAGALAGGINITTKNAFDLLSPNRSYGAYFTLGGQSNRGIGTSLATYGKIKENLGLVASYSFDDVPYYRAGNGDKVSSSQSKAHNALFKLNFLPNANHSFNLNYHFNHLTAVAPYGANVLLNANPKLFDNAILSHGISAQYSYMPTENFTLLWNNFYSYKNLTLTPREAVTNNDHEGAQDLSLQNLGSDIIFKHYFGTSKHSIKYGLNYQLITTKAHNLDDHAFSYNNKAQELGAIYGGFVGASFNFLESLSLDLGSRYDVFTYRDKVDTRHNTQGFSPYISLLYAPTNELSFKITQNYNTRGAMPLDASLLSNPHVQIAPLKAEGMHNTELNMDYDNNLFSAHISLYHQYLKNFINSYINKGEHTNGATHIHEDSFRQNMNSPIRILGYEANIGLDLDFLDVHIGIAQSFPTYKNKTITDTFELAAVSGRSYYLSAGLRPFKSVPQFHILWLSRFVERIDYQGYNMYYNEIESVHKKGYNTHNLYLTYDIKSYLSVRLAFLNITNQTYTNPMSPLKELFSKGEGTPLYEPGFNTKAQIALSF